MDFEAPPQSTSQDDAKSLCPCGADAWQHESDHSLCLSCGAMAIDQPLASLRFPSLVFGPAAFSLEAPSCLRCACAVREVTAAGHEARVCDVCGYLWLSGESVRVLQSTTLPSKAEAQTPSSLPHELRVPMQRQARRAIEPYLVMNTSQPLMHSRVEFNHPWIDVLALPLALFFGWMMHLSVLGDMLILPARIWFHELGHALPSWLSGHAALPLPIGITFWSEERSFFVTLCVLFLIGLIGVAGYREKRIFPVLLAVGLFAMHLLLRWIWSDEQADEWRIASGLIGETVLTTLVMLAFFFRLPDRVRWDLWRFVLLVPAACVFVSSSSMWWRIARKGEPLPLGSFLGGDGSGDLDRLISDYAWTKESIVHFYGSVAIAMGLVLAASLVFFTLKSLMTKSPTHRELLEP